MAGHGHRLDAAQQAVATKYQQKANELRHRAEALRDPADDRMQSSAELQVATGKRLARSAGRPGWRHTPSACRWSSAMPR